MADKIQAVIFDMGGVLLRSENYAPRTALAKKYGLSLNQLEDLVFESKTAHRATVGEITEAEHWESVYDVLKVPTEDRSSFVDSFWEGDQLDTQLIEFLDNLRPSYKTALLSNAWTGTRQTLYEKHVCKDVFDVSIFSYEVKLAKPDPAIYNLVLKNLGVAASAAIFVDDNLQNIESASRLGIHGVRFASREQALEEIRALL